MNSRVRNNLGVEFRKFRLRGVNIWTHFFAFVYVHLQTFACDRFAASSEVNRQTFLFINAVEDCFHTKY